MTRSTDKFDAAEISLRSEQLRSLVRSLVRDPERAAEVEQEVWLSALQGPLNRIQSWRAWCRAAALNFLRGSARRSASRELAPLTSEVVSNAGTPEQVAEHLQVLQNLNDSLRKLKEPYKSALVLRFLSEMEPRDIAEMIGVPASTVRSRIARGLDQLRAELDRRSDGTKSAWAVSLLGLLGPPAPKPSTAVFDLIASVTASSRVAMFTLGGLYVKKLVVLVAILGAIVAALSLLDVGDGDATMEPTVAEATEEVSGPRRRGKTDFAFAGDLVGLAPDSGEARGHLPESSVTLRGLVMNLSREPIGGAQVILRPHRSDATGAIALNLDERSRADRREVGSKSVADGSFALKVGDHGRFECFCHAQGYRPLWKTIFIGPNGPESSWLEMKLEPLQKMVCVVLDEGGVPVDGAPVRVWLDSKKDWEKAPRYLEYRAITSASGTFEVEKFPRSALRRDSPAGVIVQVEHPSFAHLQFKSLEKLPRDEAGRTILRLERGRNARIRFREFGSGKPVPGLEFKLNSVFGTWSKTARAGEDGVAELSKISTASIFEMVLLSKDWTLSGVKGESGTSRRIFRVSDREEAEFEVDLGPSLVAKGLLIDASDGRPLEGVVLRADLAGAHDPSLLRVRSSSCVTSVGGEFELTGLSAELTTFSIESGKWAMVGVDGGREPSKTLKLDRDNCRGIRILARPAATIHGVVRSPKGHPLSGARVSLVGCEARDSSPRDRRWGVGSTDADGRYTLDGLSVGENIRLIAEHPVFAPSSQTLTLSYGDKMRQVDFTLTQGASLELRVIDASGSPLKDVRVEVGIGDVAANAILNANETPTRSALSSRDGAVRFERLALGSALVVLRDDCLDGERFLRLHRRVKLSEGKQSVVIKVDNVNLIRGLARHRSGHVIANARIRFGLPTGSTRAEEIVVKTDANGCFAFEARKAAKALRIKENVKSLSQRLGGYAREGEAGWFYDLLGAQVWEMKHPSRITASDRIPLVVIEPPRIHPRKRIWEFVFDDR
ncbi:MAG: sigma-70 family RNA polymerase sigma factor [Planctomycetota bacterium]